MLANTNALRIWAIISKMRLYDVAYSIRTKLVPNNPNKMIIFLPFISDNLPTGDIIKAEIPKLIAIRIPTHVVDTIVAKKMDNKANDPQ